MLVRRVFADTPRGNAHGINRTTTVFEPQAEPKLADAAFAFAPPETQN